MLTEEQRKFKEKIKRDLDYDVNFDTYHIIRGRGWSKKDGSCGAYIDATFTDDKGITGTVTLLLCHSLRVYNRKKYRLIEFDNERTHDTFIEIEEKRNDGNEKRNKITDD